MGISIGQLFVDLGFDVDDKKLKEFTQNFKDAGTQAQQYAEQIKGFSALPLANAVAMKNFAEQTGASAQALQQWVQAARLANPALNIERATASYQRFQRQFTEIAQGRGASGVLAQLGITFDQDEITHPEKALEKIAAARDRIIKERGQSVYTNLLDQLGLGADWDAVLKLSKDKRDNLTKGIVIDQKDIDTLYRASQLYNEAVVRLEYVGTHFFAGFLNGLEKFVHDIGGFFDGHKTKNGIGGAAGGSSRIIPRPSNNYSVHGNLQESMRFWMQQGLGFYGAAALAGNEYRESGANPRAVGDNGTSFGIFQWHTKKRMDDIRRATGIDVAKAGHAEQLQAALWEMKKSGLFDRIRALSAKGDIQGATSLFTRVFERPANVDSEVAKRTAYAQQIADRFSSLNQNVTINVHTTADAKQTAQEVKRALQSVHNQTLASLNQGVQY